MPGAPLTPPVAQPVAMGFFGKIPARGDFVRAGLPRGFVDPWDAWLQAMIAGSRDILGAKWLPAWMEAPIWHFSLPAGQCGPAPVLGLWMPSVDAAGRHFPLTLACIGARGGAGWSEAAEALGLDALRDDAGPEDLARRLAALTPPDDLSDGAAARWWTEGSPFVPATELALHRLPDPAGFAAMLHAVPKRDAADQPVFAPGAEGERA